MDRNSLSKSVVIDDPFKSDADYAPQQILDLISETKRNLSDKQRAGSSMQQEFLAQALELNTESLAGYKHEFQDSLVDAEARLVNFMHEKEFTRKLQSILGPFSVFIHNAGIPKQRGLFVKIRGKEQKQFRDDLPKGIQYVTYIQVPYMPEWSLVKANSYEVADKVLAQGWRSVLVALVANEVITEDEAHRVFGEPTLGDVSTLYRRNLFHLRNHKNTPFTTKSSYSGEMQ